MCNHSKKGTKLSNDEFDKKIKDSNFIRIDNYINTNTSITFQCKLCEKKYKKKPKEFKILKCKCVEYGNNYKKSIEIKNIILLENYVNAKHKLLHKCNNCGNEFISSPKVVKNSKYGCPVCSGKKFNIEKYKSLLPNNIKIIGDYKGTAEKTKHICEICGNKWDTKPNYIIHMGTNCPICNSSKGERNINNLLIDMGVNFIKEYTVKINNIKYRYDFYLKDYNILIEYDGIQHYKPIEFFGGTKQYNIIRKNDEIKTKWAIDNNFILIRIPYYISEIYDIANMLSNFLEQ